ALWGDHRNVYGFDFSAIGNITNNHFGGIGVSGVFNYNRGTATVLGLQATGAANININKTNDLGLQVAGLFNSNRAESSVVGFQIAPIANLSTHTKVYGAQVGLYNDAREVFGFQIGLINKVDTLHGLQIGLLNFNKRGLFSVSPF